MEVRHTSRFKRDIKRLSKQHKELDALDDIVITLAIPEKLDAKHKDHALTGDKDGLRDCHIENDWLLLYRYGLTDTNEQVLQLVRTGSHSEILD